METRQRRSTFVLVLAALAAGFGAGYGLTPGFVTATQPEFPGLASRVSHLEQIVAALDTKLGCVQKQGAVDIVFEGCNVHIRNGMGGTQTQNGLGNLIVGYNEPHPDASRVLRTGSHNLIVGPRHEYTSFAGFVAGQENTVSNWFASIAGGTDNVASGIGASVSGGLFNVASGQFSTVSGGEAHTATFDGQHVP